MKNIYMLQVNYLYGNTVHLPYTAGVLLAYAFADETVRSSFEAKKIFFIREDPEKILSQIETPSVIGFSSYIWNFEYNKYIAARVKEKYPDCVIIFGGHHVRPGGDLLNECPYIDYLIHGEGEAAFLSLLKSVSGKENPENISGISYRKAGSVVTNPVKISNDEWIDTPSAYLNGWFDDILLEHRDKVFMGLIETTRGCPNSCTYCDWSNMKSRIRKFPLQRVCDEIEWISEHHILGLGAADSNFGVYERDEQIADFIIGMYQKNGFPKGFQTSWAKNSNERIFRIGCKLEQYRLSKGITLSFQSMDEKVLENIGRKNISVHTYRELMAMYNAADIGTYTELILGLPGETPQSFANGIDTLLNLGQHHTVYIHNCEWLPCSAMGCPDYMRKFGIQTSRILLNQPHIEGQYEDGIHEYSELVTATYSMSHDDWINMNLFSFTVQCFHHMGLLQLFALYLHREKGIAYRQFYEQLTAFLRKNGLSAINRVESMLRNIVNGIPQAEFTVTDKRFGKVYWPFEEYMFLCTVYGLNDFYYAITGFLKSFGIENELFDELLRFQKSMIKRPFYKGESLVFGYNFAEYFNCALKDKPGTLQKGSYTLQIKARYYDNWCDYAKNVAWYGRKDNRSIYLADAAERNENE